MYSRSARLHEPSGFAEGSFPLGGTRRRPLGAPVSAALWRQRLAQAPLAWRIAVPSATFGLIVGALAAGLGYWALSRQLQARLGTELQGKQALVAHLLSELPSPADVPDNGHRLADLLIGHDDLHLAVVDSLSKRRLVSFSQQAVESLTRVDAASLGSVFRWRGGDGRTYASMPGAATAGDGRLVRFVLSVDLRADQQLLAGFVHATLVGLPLILLLVVAGSWTVARTGLAPLKRFTRLASRVSTHHLHERPSIESLPAELGELAGDFSAMLARVDEGVRRLSEFSGDLAHEMRAPVATLLGRTQVALSRGRSVDELHDVLAGNVDELQRLTRLIADMLFLAHADQRTAVLECSSVDLAQEARRVAEFMAWVAEEHDLQIEVSGGAKVTADSILVQRAITNLLSNAIRHATASSVVRIHITIDGRQSSLTVTNLGDGIPADQLGRIFDRFVRLDEARARSEGGSGLGLAIVRPIMRLHGGDVHATSEHDTTAFTLTFPGDAP